MKSDRHTIGQGSQWIGMGVGLIATFPIARRAIRRLDQHMSTLRNPPTWKIESIMTDPASSALIHDPEYSQPLCTALQIALVDVLTSWGIRPVAVIGHSSGI